MRKSLRLGTRGSPLALIQAESVKNWIIEAARKGGLEDIAIEIVPITTSGDWRPEHKDRTFLEMGGNKGLFTKEIEEALFSRHIDMAVHSMKDVASSLPPGLSIAAILKREDPRDAFISTKYKTLDEMPAGAVVGTSSMRRQAQILAQRPDLKIVPLRGNVETRLKKLAAGQVDATLLAVAGLKRLGYADRITSILEPNILLPAGGQGALGLEVREGDTEAEKFIAPLNCAITSCCVRAEREMLRILDGSCKTPIGAFATCGADNTLILEGVVAREDGAGLTRLSHKGKKDDFLAIGEELGHQLKRRLPAGFFAA